MLTPLGKDMRKRRIDKGVRLKDMADSLGVSSAFLSSVETGKKNAGVDLIEKIASYFGLSVPDANTLKKLAEESRNEVKLHLTGLSADHREAAVALARRFSGLDSDELEKLKELLKKRG